MQSEPMSRTAVSNSQSPGKGLPRWIDATVALLALILAAPIIAIAAVAIGLTSGRPMFFRQRRVGQYGRLFEFYKLRTMRSGADGPQITSGKDSRITRIGKLLRDSKLDELPSFWNVFRGDMALVGPRPEVPRFVNLESPAWQRVLSVRPGLTDPVTFKLRSEAALLAAIEGDTEDYYVSKLQPSKLQGYVEYLEARNWRTDSVVLLKTIAAIATASKATEVEISELGQSSATAAEKI
jgi:lipopolysaccharide/colanic/teichoic acid biosynthesis glycosyltransferase